MFGGKITKHQVIHGFNRAKNFLGQAYNNTRDFLGTIDNGVNNLKTIYGALAPVLESYGVNPANKNLMKAISNYDQVKSKVTEEHDRALNHLNDVRNTLSHKKVNFDFA